MTKIWDFSLYEPLMVDLIDLTSIPEGWVDIELINDEYVKDNVLILNIVGYYIHHTDECLILARDIALDAELVGGVILIPCKTINKISRVKTEEL